MHETVLMSQTQIDELLQLARADSQLWQTFKERELRGDGVEAGEDKKPGMVAIVEELVRRTYGRDHRFSHAGLIIAMRRAARLELGLPVEG